MLLVGTAHAEAPDVRIETATFEAFAREYIAEQQPTVNLSLLMLDYIAVRYLNTPHPFTNVTVSFVNKSTEELNCTELSQAQFDNLPEDIRVALKDRTMCSKEYSRVEVQWNVENPEKTLRVEQSKY